MSLLGKLLGGVVQRQESQIYEICATLCDELAAGEKTLDGSDALRLAARSIRKLSRNATSETIDGILSELQARNKRGS